MQATMIGAQPSGGLAPRAATMQRIGAVFMVVAVLVAALWAADILFDRSIELRVVDETALYEAAPAERSGAGARQIGILRPGDTVQVTRTTHGEGFQAFHVETSLGRTGWVVRDKGVVVVRGRI
jgi:hypothetical protein